MININPQVQIGFLNGGALLCFGANSTVVTAIVTGGTPSLNYVWNGPNILSGQGTTSIEVGSAGTYGIQVLDQSGCLPATRGIQVFQQVQQPIAFAGVDQYVCQANTNSTVSLSGIVQNSNGSLWTGGLGTFNPSNDNLTAVYSPSASELQNGSVTLTLNTAQNGTCPEQSDAVIIFFSTALQDQAQLVNPVCGQNNGSINTTISGGISPYTYSWSNAQTTEDIFNIFAGQYTLTVTDAGGCISQFNYNLGNLGGPEILSSVTNVLCPGQSTGEIDIKITGC
jgi:hypothetical protein